MTLSPELTLVVGLLVLTGPAAAIVSIWDKLRRKPPIEVEFVSNNALSLHVEQDKAEHELLHRRISEFKRYADSEFVRRHELKSSDHLRDEWRAEISKQLHELTIAVADISARIDERRLQ